jgi:glutathione S-transferase
MSDRLVLHEDVRSGNCYKIRLTAAHLGLALERRHYDIMAGETRTPDFLAGVNANGRIPVLQVGDRFLPESNAACFYLADGSPLVPSDRFARADMLRWLFWEQYNHEPNVATLRFWLSFVGTDRLSDSQRALIPAKRAGGEEALALMDGTLARQTWLVAGGFSLADFCLYPYTHVADEAGFDLSQYPHLSRWLTDVAAQQGHVVMQA